MLLIAPPVAKACEPPAGIARLAAFLADHGVSCRLLDANLEGQLWLMGHPPAADDTWSRRAVRDRERNLAFLRSPGSGSGFDRYTRAVHDLNRLLALAVHGTGGRLGLADYQHGQLSPLRSRDLLQAAEQPEHDPFFPYFAQRLDGLFDTPPRIVGFSLNYLSQALSCFAMIGQVRRRLPAARIVLGGGLVSSWLARPGWQSPFAGLVDQLVAGPGEAALLELAGGTLSATTPPVPDYGRLPLDSYLSPGRIIPYSASAGCYWNRCSFCPEPAEGNRYLPVPARLAAEQLRTLAAGHHPALLHLVDNAVSPALLAALVREPPGAPWYGFVRFCDELLDEGFCRSLREAGCVMLKLGLESGDQQVLDRLDKGIDLAMAARVLANLRRAGIASYIYLLFGTPPESRGAAEATLAFVQRHAETIGFLNLAIFNMPCRAADAAELASGQFYEGDLSLYTGFRHPGGWERDQVRQFLEKVFKRDPAVAAILRRSPPFFGSNHAPFFTAGMQPGRVPPPWPRTAAHPPG